MSHHPFDIRETVARAFPGYDRVQADPAGMTGASLQDLLMGPCACRGNR
jgi:hypothetical protein